MPINVYKCCLVREGAPIPWDRRQRVNNPEAVAGVLAKFFEGADRESMVALALDTRNAVIGINVVSVGSLDSAPSLPREVFKFAVLSNAASIILGHNHPSGDPSPSIDDIRTTKRLVDAGKILGIEVLDHIIVGEEGHASLRNTNENEIWH